MRSLESCDSLPASPDTGDLIAVAPPEGILSKSRRLICPPQRCGAAILARVRSADRSLMYPP
jgi:hypothetical protein